MSEEEERLATLAWAALPQVGERTLLALLDHARESRQTMAQLWRSNPDDLARIISLHPRALAALKEGGQDYWARAAANLEECNRWGGELLVASQPDFPPVLRARTPAGARRWPWLFSYGALGLLEEPRVAFVNSKDVSPVGLEITDAAADALARRDVTLVTSTNRVAYQASATAAKRHAGPSLMVLDRGFKAAFTDGLNREPVATARVWDDTFDPELQLILTPFAWGDQWTARNGKRRDSLLFDLADVVVAVDVSTGGHIDQECRRAARLGKFVYALDRGSQTPEGTRRLWEELPNVYRASWRGGETLAEHIGKSLPAPVLEAAEARLLRGWLREVSLFLCRLVYVLGPATLRLSAYPEGSVLAQVAQLWPGPLGDARSSAVVADLWSTTNPSPARVTDLLERATPGGLVAVLVPRTWLEDASFQTARTVWLERAALRLVVDLPLHLRATVAGTRDSAAIALFQRAPAPGGSAITYAPDRAAVGRFHLRRYLRELLNSVVTEQRETVPPDLDAE